MGNHFAILVWSVYMTGRVLLIDDSSISRKMFKANLPPGNYILDEASGGLEGLAQYQKNRADVVFLDLTMPDIDGFETLSRLKALDPQVRVIIQSADVQKSSKERAFSLGAEDFLQKPLKADALREHISPWL